ncbi:MAG: acyl-CoA dehydrogenase family protein, partial [Gemmatimonadaceae bacterium]
EDARWFPNEVFKTLAAQGYLGLKYEEEYGGQGGGYLADAVFIEEMGRCGSGGLSAGIGAHIGIATPPVWKFGTEEQKQRYLPKMVGGAVGAYALSEAASGSDAFALQTRAQLQGSEYVLNGRKLWITNAKEASVFILFATLDPAAGYKGITAFIVEKDFAGFTVGKKEDKLGIRASSTCELILEDCRVPQANVLGEPGKG